MDKSSSFKGLAGSTPGAGEAKNTSAYASSWLTVIPTTASSNSRRSAEKLSDIDTSEGGGGRRKSSIEKFGCAPESCRDKGELHIG